MTSIVNHGSALVHASAADTRKLSSPPARRTVGKLSRALVNVHSKEPRSAPPGAPDALVGGSTPMVRRCVTPMKVSNGPQAAVAEDCPAPSSSFEAQLETRLHAMGQLAGWISGAGEACLRDGLQAVSSDSAAALKTLDALASLDFERLAHAWSNTPEQAQAWQLARWLAATPLGTDVLRACRAHGPVTRIQMLQLQSIHMVDQGQSMVPVAHGLDSSCDPAPGAVAARHASMSPDEISHSLARRVWDASTHLAGQPVASGAAHARDASIMSRLSEQQAGDVFAWEQGLRSEGPHGDAAHMNRHIHKFVTKALRRAGASRFKQGLARLLGKKRTALGAMRYEKEATRAERINRWYKGEAPGHQEDLKTALHKALVDLQPGESLQLVSQHRAGLQLDALGYAVALTTGNVVAPMIDLKATRTRDSMVALERTHYGWEIFIGTGKSNKLSSGLGLLMGLGAISYGAGAARAAGLVFYAGGGRVASQRDGVTIRIAQSSQIDEESAKAKAVEMLDHLLNPPQRSPSHGRDEWNRMAVAFGDDPTISISSARKRSRHRNVVMVGELGPSMAGNPFGYEARLGVALRAMASYQSAIEKSEDSSGRVQAIEYLDSKGWTMTGDAYAGIGMNTGLGNTSGFIQPSWLKRDFGAQKVLDTRQASHVRLVRKDGQLIPGASIRRVEIENFKTYRKAVEAQRSQWIDQFARDAVANVGSSALLETARAHAAAAIDLHLQAVAGKASGPYSLALQLREGACRIIDANLALIEQGADAKLANLAQARIQDVLDDPAMWAPLECSVTTTTASSGSRWLRLPLELGSNEKYLKRTVQGRLDASQALPSHTTSSSTPPRTP